MFIDTLLFCKIAFSFGNLGKPGLWCGRPFSFHYVFHMFWIYVRSAGRFKHRNPGFRRFRGYIAFQLVRAGARGSLPEPLCVAQLCKFQGKHRAVLIVCPGDSLCIVFRSCSSGILFHICSREHIANWRCSTFGRGMSFSYRIYILNILSTYTCILYICISLSSCCSSYVMGERLLACSNLAEPSLSASISAVRSERMAAPT